MQTTQKLLLKRLTGCYYHYFFSFLDEFILCCYAEKAAPGVGCISPKDEFSSCSDEKQSGPSVHLDFGADRSSWKSLRHFNASNREGR